MESDLILNDIKNKIYVFRGVQVMLDSDLAKLYNIKTKVLNQILKRNINRFPTDFSFQLNLNEVENLRSQFVTSIPKGGRTYYPYVFTEQGIAMLSGLINNEIAIEVNINIMRTFILMRNVIKSNNFLEQRVDFIEKKHLTFEIETNTKFDKIFTLLENPNSKKTQGIFFNGQVFDSHVFISDLIKSAKSELILIDNYIDENTLNLFVKRSDRVKVIIYTKKITSSLKLDLEKYNLQYEPIEIKEFELSHDRFLIIDRKEVYHIGASLKDLGLKWFAFSKLDIESLSIIDKLE